MNFYFFNLFFFLQFIFSLTTPPLHRDDILETAKDQYTKAKGSFEDHRHTVSLLQASLTPQSVLSLYGDVGRLIEETQILLYEHVPFLSPFSSPEIEQRFFYIFIIVVVVFVLLQSFPPKKNPFSFS